jgi:hypothetical protein
MGIRKRKALNEYTGSLTVTALSGGRGYKVADQGNS